MEEKYFETEEQLIEYAKKLTGKSLNEFIQKEKEKTIREDYSEFLYEKGKGSLGHSIESIFFGYKPNSFQGADFHILNRELKVAPLKKISKKKNSEEIRLREGISAKERIVLTSIDYMKLAKETWENNTMVKKIRLLLMFYLHEADKKQLDYIFKLIEFWEPSPEDMKIIRGDWEKIQKKVLEGEAHYISEGDTLYLGACTKGATAEKSLKNQPYNEIQAKGRAFSLKNSYVNAILNELLERQKSNNRKQESKQIKLLSSMDKNLEEALNDKFFSYYGKNMMEIAQELEIKIKNSKNFNRIVINKILGGREDAIISEIEKAGIEIKVIRCAPNGKIPEHISFPSFDFIEVAENDWDDSVLKETLETTKYLFIVLKMDCTNSEFSELSEEVKYRHLKLDKILLWNMPMKDIENSARIMWEKTKKVIQDGVKITVVGKRRFNKFPNASESETMHVRPHARDSRDTKPLPNGKEFTKQSFWLNKEYIEKIIKK